jgi:hypothetical protein
MSMKERLGLEVEQGVHAAGQHRSRGVIAAGGKAMIED